MRTKNIYIAKQKRIVKDITTLDCCNVNSTKECLELN